MQDIGIQPDQTTDLLRLSKLNALLEAGLEIAQEHRQAWIDALPRDTESLKQRLAELLGAEDERTANFLQRSVQLDQVAASFDTSIDDQEGDEIGTYRLIRKLGTGGMGTVWLAERSDGTIKRRVALKLPSVGWSPSLIERMRREKDFLASLEHPHIARLYDSGVTNEGRPYLVMEFVDGLPIDAYCDDNKLAVKQRLQLFLQVADALAHAHARLIVHRDIKPNNILVTPHGGVRLLDFGVAKLIEVEKLESDDQLEEATRQGKTSRITRIAARALTPDYASPEQILNADITVASDVYSLGVVLFELLVGKRPYRLLRTTDAALEEAIIYGDLPLASQLAPRELVGSLRGDLDGILAKAMRRNIRDRYLSVEAFAADIRRHLANEPVLAAPAGQIYRCKKFIHRHWIGVSAFASIAIALCGGAGLALWQASVAREQARRADDTKRFVTSILVDARPRTVTGGVVKAADLLIAAIPRIEKELSRDESTAAELGILIAESLRKLGEPDNIEVAIRAAIPRAERSFGHLHPKTVLAKIELAGAIALKQPQEAIDLVDSFLPSLTDESEETTVAAMEALRAKSFAAALLNNKQIAIESLTEAIRLGEARLKNNEQHERLIISLVGFLSNTHGKFGDRAKMLELSERAVVRARAAFSSQRPHHTLTAAERWYGDALSANGRPADAIIALRQVLIDQTKSDAFESLRVRHAKYSLARALNSAGEIAEAVPLIAEAVKLEAKQNPDHESERGAYAYQYAVTLSNARLSNEALTEYTRSGKAFERSSGETVAQTTSREIGELVVLAHSSPSRMVEERALSMSRLAEISPANRALAFLAAAVSARLRNAPTVAQQYVREALAVSENAQIPMHTRARIASFRDVLSMENSTTSAALEGISCASLFTQAQITLLTVAHECVVAEARKRMAIGKSEEAERTLAPLVDAWEKSNANSPWHGEALFWLAKAQARAGNMKESAETRSRAHAILRKSQIPILRRLVQTH
jgi:eukaryotic-like serine/threonine-protein kinase